MTLLDIFILCVTEFAEIEMLLFGFERCFRLIRTFTPLSADKLFAPFTKKSTIFAMCQHQFAKFGDGMSIRKTLA